MSFEITLESKKTIAHNVLELQFTKPADFNFAPGQFVQCAIPTEKLPTWRSYSISSTPADPYIEFCVKLLDDGVASQHFAQMQIGDALQITAAKGRFTQQVDAEAHLFVATGAGIAPIMSILRHEIEEKLTSKQMTLVFGVRSYQDLFWLDRLQSLAEKASAFQYHVTLSQPEKDDVWEGLEGRVTHHVLHHMIDHHAYLCGSPEMVKDVRKTLIDDGIDAKGISFEIF